MLERSSAFLRMRQSKTPLKTEDAEKPLYLEGPTNIRTEQMILRLHFWDVASTGMLGTIDLNERGCHEGGSKIVRGIVVEVLCTRLGANLDGFSNLWLW